MKAAGRMMRLFFFFTTHFCCQKGNVIIKLRFTCIYLEMSYLLYSSLLLTFLSAHWRTLLSVICRVTYLDFSASLTMFRLGSYLEKLFSYFTF